MPHRFCMLAVCTAICLGQLGCTASSRGRDESPASQPATTAAHESAAASPPAGARVGVEAQSQPATAADASPLRMLDNFHAIEEGRAYRCAQLYPETLDWVIQRYGIRTVVNLRGPNPQMEWYPRQKAVCEKNTITQIDIPLSAFNLPPPEQLLALYDAFKSAPEPILIHCRAGADRSGMASALWRMTQRGDSSQTAASELSLKYGHFRIRHPKMLDMVEMFQPRREWITDEYPRIYQEKKAAADAAAGVEE
ncbi:MAG: fused DSP-PTPase phosphatase/NAD kinase-like protein [Phycisphaerae bacterium]